MDDEEDVKKMIELLKSSQENTQDYQYDDFINCGNSDVEENEETINLDDDYDFCNFTATTDISKLNSYDPRSTLKPEERYVIDSCLDPELKNLLLLNRTKNFQLMQLYKKLKDLLIQCQKDIVKKSEIITNFLKANKDQTHSTGAWRLAAPYFKDKKLYACPPNADTIRKNQNKELSVYEISVPRKWSDLECKKLIRAIRLNYNINQQKSVLKKIRDIQESSNMEDKLHELVELENKMEELRNDDSSMPPLNSDQYIDWMRVAEVFLKDQKTFFECKSFWHIYLHPSINKSPWTPEENEKLKNIADKHKFQNWDKIAEKLGNNRTGFTTCVNYYSNVHDVFKRGDFTYDEDSMLIELVNKHKMGNYVPWFKIAQHFKVRTRIQLHHRYTYYLSQSRRKMGKFTDAEDILLMILVDRFGKHFSKFSEYLPTRSAVQIRSRYNTNLYQKIKKGSFTLKDDELILKYVEEHGEKSWTELTKVLHRSRGQVRQRYNTIKAILDKKPNLSLPDLPRRKHRVTEEDDSFTLLRIIADQFVDSQKIPTLQEIEKVLKKDELGDKDNDNDNIDKIDIVNEDVPEEIENMNSSNFPCNIDDMLTNFFCDSFTINHSKCTTAKYAMKAAKDVKKILNVLNVDLDIPKHFDKDLRLDNLDVAIFSELANNSKSTIESDEVVDASELVPPNLNTLLGLRSLLIKYSTEKTAHQEIRVYKRKNKQFHSGIRSAIMKQLLNIPDETRLEFENNCKLFFNRFQALFKWPAIISLLSPSSELQETSINTILPMVANVKRTYSRVQPPEKRLKISEMPSSSATAVPLKLTPVTNKSVIEDLLRNKHKKLFSIEAVQCGGSETRTIIKEVKFRSAANNVNSAVLKDKLKCTNSINNTIQLERKCEVSDENQKLSQVASDHEDAFDVEEEDLSHCDVPVDKNVIEDMRDLNKLVTFLNEQSKCVPNEDNDLEDFKKLELFLNVQEKQEQISSDSDNIK